MPTIIELARAASPHERVALLTELSRDALAGANGPVALVDARNQTIGYLSAELNAACTLPVRQLTPDRFDELRHRAEHPEESIPADEFIRLLEADISVIQGR